MQRWAETIWIPLVSSEAQITNKNCSACQQETEITAGSRAESLRGVRAQRWQVGLMPGALGAGGGVRTSAPSGSLCVRESAPRGD